MVQNPDLKQSVDLIVDVMTDGVSYAQFIAFIDRLDQLAKKGDHHAQGLLRIVRRFGWIAAVASMPNGQAR